MQFDLPQAIDVLQRTPGTLDVLLRGLGDDWSRATEGPDTFSPFDVVGHLIDGEETDWIPRARIILARGANPVFEPYDRFRHRTRNAGRTLPTLLDEFARLRRRASRSCAAGSSRTRSSTGRGATRGWARSRSASCWPRGSCTIWDTSPRSRA